MGVVDSRTIHIKLNINSNTYKLLDVKERYAKNK